MRRSWMAGLLGLSTAAALGVPAMVGQVTADAAAWSATSTRAEPLGGLVDLGPLAGQTAVPVTVELKLRNAGQLARDIASGRVLSSGQFIDQFAPTPTQASQVAAYLSGRGYRDVKVSPNLLQVTASGTAAQAQSSFDTVLHAVGLGGRTLFANVTPASVPSTLSPVVGAVLGLNDVASMTRAATTNPPSSCVVAGIGYPCTYNPQGFWKAYDAPASDTGSGTPVAVFADGDVSQVTRDLRTEEAANGLPQVPYTVVATGPAGSDTSGIDEWDLDTQYSTGMAGSVSRLYIYDATSLSDSDLANAFNSFAAQNTARAGNASFGECEYQAYLDGSLMADDQAFAEAAAQGQTVFASAGDTGGFCPVVAANGVPAGLPDVNYPASSPYVVGVGGTTLVTNADGSYGQELAWVAGGGGVSLFESSPPWQRSGAGVLGLVGTACGLQPVAACGRAVPDVANDADPNSGADVYVDGAPLGVGGTSLAAPLTMGEWARLESAGGNALGFAGPRLYRAAGSAAFHDIVLGDTGPYPALPGYDLATGLGTLDVGQALKVIG